jgi:hypothetical protein
MIFEKLFVAHVIKKFPIYMIRMITKAFYLALS